MRKRNRRIWAHLNDDEYERFMADVKQSGLLTESYLRFLINGLVPKPKPPVDYFTMINELRELGKSLRHITSKAATNNMVNSDDFIQLSMKLDNQIAVIQDAVELPYKR